MNPTLRTFLALACAWAGVVLVPANSSQAAFSLLTGGDSGDGWTAPVAPYHVVISGNILHQVDAGPIPVVQGVAFPAMDSVGYPTARANLTGAYQQNWSLGTNLGASANDDNLERILQSGANPAGFYTLNLTGLIANFPYRIDLFGHTTANNATTPNTVTVHVDGVPMDTFDEVAGAAYLVTYDVLSNGAGQIQIGIEQTLHVAPSNPMMNGFALTVLPEPSIAMVVVGCVGPVLRRRR